MNVFKSTGMPNFRTFLANNEEVIVKDGYAVVSDTALEELEADPRFTPCESEEYEKHMAAKKSLAKPAVQSSVATLLAGVSGTEVTHSDETPEEAVTTGTVTTGISNTDSPALAALRSKLSS